MPRVAALLLVASALLICGTPGLAQAQPPPAQHPYAPPQQAPPQQPQDQKPQQIQPQQPQFQQQRPQMQQIPFEQRRALQLPGTLIVERAGITAGRIVTLIGGHVHEGVDCGSQCEYRQGSNPPGTIRLALFHDPGSTQGDLTRALEGSLLQWSGASCFAYGWTCDVHMSAQARERVIATIGKPRLTFRMVGNGPVPAADGHGPVCPGSGRECVREFAPAPGPNNTRVPQVVTLRDSSPGPRIWTGCDAGGGGVSLDCKVGVTLASEVNVRFQVVVRSVTISKVGTGSGDVLTNPAPVGRCIVQPAGAPPCLAYEHGTDLTLTASGQFARWEAGPCNGQTTPTCRFTVGADTAVSAFYKRPQ